LDKPIILPPPGRPFILPSPTDISTRRFSLEYWCKERANEFILVNGWKVDDEERLKIAKAVSVGAQRAALVLMRRKKGDFSPNSLDYDVTRPVDPSAPRKPREPVTFKSLLEGWAAEKRPTVKTIYRWNRVIEQLGDFVGHKDAARLTADDLLRWKAALLEAGLRTKTIRDSKIAPLRAILQWGVDNRKLAANLASGIVVDARAKANERIRGFTDDEAVLILQHASKEHDPVKRCGARLSEVCQLRTEDIFENGNLWCVKFDPAAGSLKNQNSERAIPLHPAIIEAGFLQFVESAGLYRLCLIRTDDAPNPAGQWK
jgi:hypothetical protein